MTLPIIVIYTVGAVSLGLTYATVGDAICARKRWYISNLIARGIVRFDRAFAVPNEKYPFYGPLDRLVVRFASRYRVRLHRRQGRSAPPHMRFHPRADREPWSLFGQRTTSEALAYIHVAGASSAYHLKEALNYDPQASTPMLRRFAGMGVLRSVKTGRRTMYAFDPQFFAYRELCDLLDAIVAAKRPEYNAIAVQQRAKHTNLVETFSH